ncbi:hypothetical protein BDW42DRAFT_81976 [Aspergillus taichungensis]|uniref:PWI domain-containing protein n=1 Tax=Aspergillus taichungensis TaxID=482145 RepID=A0A2J5HXW2_9EURO|nr:hypothetical protein BDW42DRAFT_81976 [Aspergillus taichungensis]
MATSVDAKLLRQTKFPPEFSRKVDMTKVNIEVMKKWIAGKISEILGNEDDVVIELCFNLLEGTRYPDIKSLQIQLTGFLDKDTANFCKELWSLCLSGQENPQGVPKELLEAKKLELIQEKVRPGLLSCSCQTRHSLTALRSRQRRRPSKRDDRKNKSNGGSGKWKSFGGATVRIEGVEEEEVGAGVGATSIVVHRPPDDVVGIDFAMRRRPDATSTHTYHRGEADAPAAPDLAPSLRHDPLPLVANNAIPAGTGTGAAAVGRPAGRSPRNAGGPPPGDAAARTMAIECGLLPAAVPRAHAVPEEIAGDPDRSRRAAHPVHRPRLLPGAEEGALRPRMMIGALRDGEDPRLTIPHAHIKENRQLMLQRSARPVMIAA